MRKSIAKRNLIALAIVALIGLFFTFASFNVPFTHYTDDGFIGGMPLGTDLGEGIIAFYETSQNDGYEGDYEESLKTAVTDFNTFLGDQFTEFSVTQTDTGLKILVPNDSNISSLLSVIDGAGSIEFKSEESDEAEAVITGANIEQAIYADNDGTPGVLIYFDDTGEDLFYTLTSDQAGNSIYIYIGGELFFSPTVSEGISGGVTFISGNMNSALEAQAYAYKITASILGVNLNLVDDPASVQASLGEYAYLYLAIVGAILFAGAFVWMILKYKQLGVVGAISLAMQFAIWMLVLNLMGTVYLNLPTILGIFAGFAISVLTIHLYFKRILEEFATGKKIPISLRIANKSTLFTVLDITAPLVIAGIVISWLTSGVAITFAIPFTIGVALSAFFTLLVLKGMVSMYKFTNATKYEKYGYKKIVEVASNEEK